MKKSIILLAAVASVSFANAQKISEKEVPTVVKSSLQKKYSNAKELKWEKENGNYEAGFEVKETDYSVLLDASGNIIETEIGIGINALPPTPKPILPKTIREKK